MPLPNASQGGTYAISVPGDINGNVTSGGQIIQRSTSYVLTLASAARATYTSGQLGVTGLTELAIDFNVTTLTGGVSPTVTFKISRVGTDGVLYQLEQATALSVAGVISYNIGSGLDNKAFGDLIQVDMVLTGGPTSITFSGSIKGK